MGARKNDDSKYDRVVRIHHALKVHRLDLHHGLLELQNPLALERYVKLAQALHATQQLSFTAVHLRFRKDTDKLLRDLTEASRGTTNAKALALKVYVAINAALLAARDSQTAPSWGQREPIDAIDKPLVNA